MRRLKQIARTLRQQFAFYKGLYQDPRTPHLARFLLWAALAYTAMPFDLTPDFLPVIGHLDDVIIVPGLIFLAVQLIPIADAMVQGKIQQFESKVFGSELKIPDNPVKPGDKILVSIWKVDWTAGGFPTLLLAIALGVLGGLGGVGVLLRLKR